MRFLKDKRINFLYTDKSLDICIRNQTGFIPEKMILMQNEYEDNIQTGIHVIVYDTGSIVMRDS